MKFLDKIRMVKSYWPITKFCFYSLLKRNRPLYGLFFQITNKCNARCLMCFNWQQLNKLDNELTLEEIEKTAKTIGPVPLLTLGGGEPFLHKDLVEICQIFSKYNGVKKISIPTNSLLPDKIVGLAKRIVETCPVKLKITLSLDGVDKVHDYIRGVEGAFDKFLETYRQLDQLSRKYPQIQISINTTISDKNQDDVLQVIDFVDKNLSVKFHTLEVIRGCYNQNNVQAPSLDRYQQLIKQILESKTTNQNKYHKLIYAYYHRQALNILKQKKQLIPCRVSSFMPVIDAEGNVYSCELLPSIGNLRTRDYNFLEIWQSAKAKQQRRDIAHKKCYCTHYCYQIQNIPMSLFHFFKAIFKT